MRTLWAGFTAVLAFGMPTQAHAQVNRALNVQSPHVCLLSTPSMGWCGDWGPATRARLASPGAIVALPDGGFAFVDRVTHVIRLVDTRGIIQTLARIGNTKSFGVGEEGGCELLQLALAPDGSVVVASPDCAQVFSVSRFGAVRVVAGRTGNSNRRRPLRDGQRADGADLLGPEGVAVKPDGTIYFTDGGRLRRVNTDGEIYHVPLPHKVEGGGLAFTPRGDLLINSPKALWRLRSGRLAKLRRVTRNLLSTPLPLRTGGYMVPVFGNHRVAILRAGASARSIAGSGIQGFAGDGGRAVNARLDSPNGVAILRDGSIVVSDAGNDRIRRIGRSGVISTAAGSGRPARDGQRIGSDVIPSPLPADHWGCPPGGCQSPTYLPLAGYFYLTNKPLVGRVGRTLDVRFITTRRANVSVSATRKGFRTIRIRQSVAAGARTLRLRGNFRRGRYRVTIAAPTSDPPTSDSAYATIR